MANENEKNGLEDKIEGIESALSRTEHYFEENQKSLTIIVVAIIAVVGAYFAFNQFYMKPREERAVSQMFMAEKYFEADSLKKALNGDGNYPGFLTIIDEYSMTKSANLSQYYAGICYKNLGKYQEAIDCLKKFNGNDRIVANLALGSIADCYAELGQTDDAIKYYKKAAGNVENNFSTPIYLMRAATLLESKNENAEALEIYERIQKEFFKTQEGQQAQKYIERVKAKGNL